MSRIKFSYPIIFILSFAFFAKVSLLRLVAGDEGFYVLASKLVSNGNYPYLDFFYPQMPLLPYVYAIGNWIFYPLAKLLSSSQGSLIWESSRLFSSFLAAILSTLLFYRLNSRYGIYWAVFGTFIFNSSTLTFAWFVTSKTFTLSTLLLFSTYLLTTSKLENKNKYLIAGVLFGLSVDVRFFFIGLMPLFLLGKKKSEIIGFISGTLIALLPVFYLAFKDFEVFWFNNLGYHMIRSSRNFESALQAKITIARIVTGLRDTQQFSGFQFPFFIWICILSATICFIKKEIPTLALLIIALLFAINITPTPSYVQYFCTLMPFLIIETIAFLKLFSDSIITEHKYFKNYFLVLIVLIISFFHLSATKKDLISYTKSGKGVIGVGINEASDKTLVALKSIAKAIDHISLPGQEVLAEWPGYLVDSHAISTPGLENHFGWKIGNKINKKERRKYKIISRNEIRKLILTGTPPVVLLERKSFDRNYKNDLKGYELINEIHNVLLFKKIT
ncbi:MAG: hypothetical protein SGJ02_02870 [bacterium]|nr:hypothetical protein [bacterium]